MSTTAPQSPGIPLAVIGASVATGLGFLPGISAFDGPVSAGELLALGWPPLGLVAALILDRNPTSRLGWVLAGLASLPLVIFIVALLVLSNGSAEARLDQAWLSLGIVPLLASVAMIAWAMGLASDRLSRRRMTWFLGWATLVFAVSVGFAQSGDTTSSALATMLGMWCLATALTLLATAGELRPIDEPLVEAACFMAALAVGGAAGVLIWWAGRQGHLPAPKVAGVIVAAIVVALLVPVAWWGRNRHLERRYGKGVLAPEDVAAITADLRAEGDPRALLGKAATMVVTASGHKNADIVLGEEDSEHPGHWVIYPLTVAGEKVGTLAIDPLHAEGPEPRQTRTVNQMAPTLALIAQAVSLAVRAEHARVDVLRERDNERTRILGDLHDGVGPLLAGLRMRVQARIRSDPSDWVRDMAEELGEVRSELRRVVSGLTPSALDDGDLNKALEQLTTSFRDGGANVHLSLALSAVPRAEVAVAVYRFVAEGTTNAIRHAHASQIAVSVRDYAGAIEAEVIDDGVGGIFTPGVGLTSLRRRAEDLGGGLRIEKGEPGGTRLCLALPTGEAA